jgi:ribosomal protein S18 acetylase RimI-like enzyme
MVKKLIPNEKKYYEFIRFLRTHPKLQYGFVFQGEITKKQQEKYMKIYGKNYYICLYNDEPVGFIGVVNRDIRLAVHPDHQRKGVGIFMLNEIMKIYPDALGKVKVNNKKSMRLFKKAGFVKKFYLYELEKKI